MDPRAIGNATANLPITAKKDISLNDQSVTEVSIDSGSAGRNSLPGVIRGQSRQDRRHGSPSAMNKRKLKKAVSGHQNYLKSSSELNKHKIENDYPRSHKFIDESHRTKAVKMVESAAGSQIVVKKDLKTIDHIEGGADLQVNRVDP